MCSIGFLQCRVSKPIEFKNALMNRAIWEPRRRQSTPRPVASARPLGGPVTLGKPYLVGERGPEIFVQGATGRVETNNTLRRLTADGQAAMVASSLTTNMPRGSSNVTHNWNISGVTDPRAVVAEIDRYMGRLEAEQRGYLSD
jgi:hypothetical protein